MCTRRAQPAAAGTPTAGGVAHDAAIPAILQPFIETIGEGETHPQRGRDATDAKESQKEGDEPGGGNSDVGADGGLNGTRLGSTAGSREGAHQEA